MLESLLGFAVMLLLVLGLRVPIAFALAVVGFVGYTFLVGYPAAVDRAAQVFTGTVQNDSLAVVPLFILMGNFVARAGLGNELYNASNAFLGHRRGGLAMATILACGGFSAICGSSLATAATMSKVAMPSMRRFGYADSLATASIAAGGTLGILIPPSVILIIYGFLTETSVRDLFAAGFIPGFIGVLLYLLAVQYVVARQPEAGPRGAFHDLRGVTWDDDRILACEAGAGAVRVYQGGSLHWSLHLPVQGHGRFRPAACAVLSTGQFLIACADTDASAILLCDPGGRVRRVIAEAGENVGQVCEPSDVIVEESIEGGPRIVVIDSAGARVQVFTLEGRCFGAFPQLTGS